MRDLIIIGAGDYAQEIRWVVERINKETPTWNILGYVDAKITAGTYLHGLPVLGTDDYLVEQKSDTDLVFAIANCVTKQKIANRLERNRRLHFPILIDPSAIVSDKAKLEKGVVICAGSILMPHVTIGSYANINLMCTVGHDATIGDYSTIYPGCNISGKAEIGEKVEIGTGAKIIQGVSIRSEVIIGAGAVIVNNIVYRGTYVGIPAKSTKE